MSADGSAPVEVFVSYSHKDDAWREKLDAQLSLLRRQGHIHTWHDGRIVPGQEWAQEIHDRLHRAAVILLLISADFIASKFCYEREMTRALERHDAGDARVVPVILRHTEGWRGAPFGRLQALPKDGKPVKSWTDEDEALADVTGGIRRVVEELRSLARPSYPTGGPATGDRRNQRLPAIWNVPYLRNPSFTGRDALLDELHANLTDGRVALTAVRGMGGVGKTQLALEYAYRHAGDFDLVWWLRAEEPATLMEDYAALAEPLGLAKTGEAELAALANAVREALTRRDRWLLVFDNATGPNGLMNLLPRAGGGRVLITSRNPSWPFALPLNVPVLERDPAIRFLLAQTVLHDRNAADALATQLGDLPLALAQAAAYVTETGVDLAGYLELFCSRREELWAAEKPVADYPATVGTTMAIDRLRADEPLALDLLSLCAFLAPEAIPRRLLMEHHEALPEELGAAVAEPLRLNRLVAALRRYSLVEVTGEALNFHRLVQAATRDALAAEETRRWVAAAVALMRAGFPYDRDDPSTWGASGALLPHVLAAAAHAEESARDIEGASYLLNVAAGYFERRAELHQAKRLLERARELTEAAIGPDDPAVATYVNNLGLVLAGLGDLVSARAAYEQALAITETSSPEVATIFNNLGNVLQDLGDLAGARAAYERALKIEEASFGPDHASLAPLLNNLGDVLRELGDLAGAKAACERALELAEARFGDGHPNVATAVNNLGAVLRAQGDLAGARVAFERALKIDEASFGQGHPKIATRINNLGSVLRAQGDLADAKMAYERALDILEKFLPADHPNVVTTRENLRIVVEEQGRTGSNR